MEEVPHEELIRTLYGWDVAQVGARWLTKQQMRHLFEQIGRDRDRLLLGLMAETGAKCNEILELGRQENPGKLSLPRRDIELPLNMARLLAHYQANLPGERLFTISNRQVERLTRSYGERASIPRMTTHLFRTSFAVYYLAEGGNESRLAALLGYRDSGSVNLLLKIRADHNDFRPMGVTGNVSREIR